MDDVTEENAKDVYFSLTIEAQTVPSKLHHQLELGTCSDRATTDAMRRELKRANRIWSNRAQQERIYTKVKGDGAKSKKTLTNYHLGDNFIHTYLLVTKTLTNYHLDDKHLVPLKATNHADYSGPPVKASKPNNILKRQEARLIFQSIILQVPFWC